MFTTSTSTSSSIYFCCPEMANRLTHDSEQQFMQGSQRALTVAL